MNFVQVSIIIATRNRELVLWQTAAKAVEAIHRKNAEIIIVNDGDHPLNPPRELMDKVRYFNNPGRGVSSARNFGAANANADTFFFIDDDMWIVAEAVDWIIDRMKDESSEACVYNLNWEYPSTLFQTLQHSKIGRYLVSANYNCMWGRMHESGTQPAKGLYRYSSIASGSLVMKKKLFDRLGGYNENMIFQGEDIDLSNRILKLSIPVYAVFDVTLLHNQQDRLEINGYLNRVSSGYSSEFKSAKAGLIKPLSNRNYTGNVRAIFEIFLLTEKTWILFYKMIPNHPAFKPVSNKLVGLLSGLTRFKEWKKVSQEKDN